ncbi:MAG: protein kinase domain-containing protein [Planctomycetota bacterium]
MSSGERNVEIALQCGLLVGEEVDQAHLQIEAWRHQGREVGLWQAVQELGFLSREAAERIERRHATAEVAAPMAGRYQINNRLGRGGMGEVYFGEAEDGSEAAIKILPQRLARDAEYLGRFQREIRAQSLLEDEHIVRYFDHGTVDGRPFLAMELVRGISLKDHIKRNGALSEDQARVLLGHMASALQVAWGAGLVHRDVKPANILLAPPRIDVDEPFCAKLCDFGLAKFQVSPLGDEPLTNTGIAIGTPHYMSPEQAAGDNAADPRHDIYGLGATIYHALLGQTLYSGRSSAVIMHKHVTARLDMRPLRDRRIAPALIDLLEAMLAKPRDLRIGDYGQILEDLARLPKVATKPKTVPLRFAPEAAPVAPTTQLMGDGLPVDTPSPSPTPSAPPVHRWGGLMAGIVVALVALVALTWWWLHPDDDHRMVTVAVTPATIAQAWNEAPGMRLRLEPGVYRGPLRLGGNGPHELVAAVSGVVIHGGDDAAAIEVVAGGRAAVVGCTIIGDGPHVLHVASGAELSVRDCQLDASFDAVLSNGDVTVRDSRITSGETAVMAKAGSALRIIESVIVGGGLALDAEASDVMISRSRLRARDGRSQGLISGRGGSVAWDRVAIDGGGRPLAVEFHGCSLVEMVDVVITGSAGGLVVDGVGAGLAERVTIEASRVGLEWHGSDVAWRWRDLRITAPVPVRGLDEVDVSGGGVDRGALRGIPR